VQAPGYACPADLAGLADGPAGCMIRPFGGGRPPRGGTLSRGPSSGRAGRPGGCPIASKRTGPLLPPRCGLGIRRVPIPDSAITGPHQPRPPPQLCPCRPYGIRHLTGLRLLRPVTAGDARHCRK
jgi:hypothetical protein